jgi:NAD(P)-dependent dehydrogenase (short-subunit alcohol dehydrogenase family)
MPLLDTFSLAGRRALVTGGNRGLGRAFALALAEAGADVAVAGRDEAANKAVAAELADRGCRGVAVTADVTAPDDVDRMARRSSSSAVSTSSSTTPAWPSTVRPSTSPTTSGSRCST